MRTLPAQPKIFHITHIDNLSSIVSVGCIEADSRRLQQGSGQTSIGMTEIKRRRLCEITVSCHPGTKVGEYMLYILHMGNHPDLAYRGGQRPILHLQADMEAAIRWADEHGVRWAFSDRNAGSYYTEFFRTREELDRIDWNAVMATDFRDMEVKEGKQAEFLFHDTCPWHLVEKIGVLNVAMRDQVNSILQTAQHKPMVVIEKTWYY